MFYRLTQVSELTAMTTAVATERMQSEQSMDVTVGIAHSSNLEIFLQHLILDINEQTRNWEQTQESFIIIAYDDSSVTVLMFFHIIYCLEKTAHPRHIVITISNLCRSTVIGKVTPIINWSFYIYYFCCMHFHQWFHFLATPYWCVCG